MARARKVAPRPVVTNPFLLLPLRCLTALLFLPLYFTCELLLSYFKFRAHCNVYFAVPFVDWALDLKGTERRAG